MANITNPKDYVRKPYAYGLTETHSFNEDSLHIGTTVKNGSVTVSQGSYQYGAAASNQTLMLSSSDKTYNAAGSAFAETQMAYTYSGDALGNVTRVTETFPAKTDRNGDVISYAYDENGRLKRQEDPDGAVKAYAYNLDGNQLSRAHKKVAPVSGERGRIGLVIDDFHEKEYGNQRIHPLQSQSSAKKETTLLPIFTMGKNSR